MYKSIDTRQNGRKKTISVKYILIEEQQISEMQLTMKGGKK